jgi:hypothetical protein
MRLDEAKQILKNNGYIVEDNQPQMSRKNLRKWLTSKYGIEFNRMTIGTYVSRYIVNVPDDERQPITALKIERYVKPIDSAAIFDMFNEEGEETLTGGVQYEVSMEDITNYSKQEMAKYFNDLFAKDSDFWKINRIK